MNKKNNKGYEVFENVDYDFEAEIYIHKFIDADNAAKILKDYGFEIIEKKRHQLTIGSNKEHFETIFQTKLEEKWSYSLKRNRYLMKEKITIPDYLQLIIKDIKLNDGDPKIAIDY